MDLSKFMIIIKKRPYTMAIIMFKELVLYNGHLIPF